MFKKIQFTLIGVLGFGLMSFAQMKPVQKATIKTPTVQCEMCKDRIEKYLSREDGVSTVKVDYKRKTTTVSWLADRTNIENIKTSIANAGYDADDVAAEESAYKKLPKCCKKPDVTASPLKN